MRQHVILKGVVDYWVLDGDQVVEERRNNNLILNQGLDYVAEMPFVDCFKYCCVGSGSAAVAASDTQLGQEVVRAGNATGASFNGSSLNGSDFISYRTFVFPEENGVMEYLEAGFSPYSGTSQGLFSRVLFATDYQQGVYVGSGQRLKVKYSLSVSFSGSATSSTAPINGVSKDVQVMAQKISLMGVDADGNTVYYDDGSGCNEPSMGGTLFLSDDNISFASLGSSSSVTASVSRYAKPAQYVQGAREVSKGTLFFQNEVPTGFKMAAVGASGVGFEDNYGVMVKFDNYQPLPEGSGFLAKMFYNWGRDIHIFNTSLGEGLLSYWNLNSAPVTSPSKMWLDSHSGGHLVVDGFGDPDPEYDSSVGGVKFNQSAGYDAYTEWLEVEPSYVNSNWSFPSGEASFAIWLKMIDTLPAAAFSASQGLVSAGDWSVSNMTIYPTGAGTNKMAILRNGAVTCGGTSVDKTSWHLLTVSCGNDAYVVAQNENNILYSGASTTAILDNNYFRLGWSYTFYVFRGWMKCGGIWNRPLTSADRTLLYNGGTPREYSDL